MKTEDYGPRNGAATSEPAHRTIEVRHICGHAETYTLLETGFDGEFQERQLRGTVCAQCTLESLRGNYDLELVADNLPYLLSDGSISETEGQTARVLALNTFRELFTDMVLAHLTRSLAAHNLLRSYREHLRELITENRASVWMTAHKHSIHAYVMEQAELDRYLH